MDFSERCVLRRKMPLMTETLLFRKQWLVSLKKQGLITDSQMKEILNTSTTGAKVLKLVSILEADGKTNFQKFCFTMEHEGYEELSDELQVELWWEKGRLDLSAHALQEAKLLTNKLTENDEYIREIKRDEVERLMASRYVVAREAMARQLQRRTRNSVAEVHDLQGDIRSLYTQVEEFLRRIPGGEKLVELMSLDDLKGVSSKAARNGSVAMLAKRLQVLGQVFDKVMEEHEKLIVERETCYELLKVDRSQGNLDEILGRTLNNVTNEIGANRSEAQSRAEENSSLETQVRDLRKEMGKQLSHKALQIEDLQKANKQKDEAIKSANQNAAKLKHQSDVIEAQLDYWKKRCETLEKTRRLGYYYLSWYENAKVKKDYGSPTGVQNGHPTQSMTYFDPDAFSGSGPVKPFMDPKLSQSMPQFDVEVKDGRVQVKDKGLPRINRANDNIVTTEQGYGSESGGSTTGSGRSKAGSSPITGGKQKQVSYRPSQSLNSSARSTGSLTSSRDSSASSSKINATSVTSFNLSASQSSLASSAGKGQTRKTNRTEPGMSQSNPDLRKQWRI